MPQTKLSWLVNLGMKFICDPFLGVTLNEKVLEKHFQICPII